MDNSITGLVTGFSQGLSAYLGDSIKQKRKQQNDAYESQLDMQKDANKAQLDLGKQSALKAYELTLAGKLDPETASALFPEGAKVVNSFNQSNGRMPTVEEFTKLMSGTGREDTKTANREQRYNTAALQFSEQLQRNPIYKSLGMQGISLDSVDQLVEQMKGGNTVASAALGAKIARAMGEVGVLTEEDVKRYRRSGALAQKGADTMLNWIEGRPTEATLDEIQQMAGLLKQKYAEKVQPIYDDYVNRLSENMGMPKEEASRRLNVPYAGSVKQGKKGEGKAPAKTNSDPLGLGI